MPKTLEVFQDLSLRSSASKPELRKALLEACTLPWTHAAEREQNLKELVGHDEDAIAFERKPADGLPAVGLILWSVERGYEVSNIVPVETGELGEARYNMALQDFVKRVVEPATKLVAFEVDMSANEQSLADWTSQEAADALHRFSVLANKSTGSSHPMDRKRWFAFLIAVHHAGRAPSPEVLSRWLVDAEGWPDRTAHALALEFEFALALMQAVDGDGQE